MKHPEQCLPSAGSKSRERGQVLPFARRPRPHPPAGMYCAAHLHTPLSIFSL
ncbi:hypothetical protein CHCC20335_3499 [Bacillus paralicheniformis]|nr:hypothetical protein CHCC20335_3499 [Bacillus paralicheniformis]